MNVLIVDDEPLAQDILEVYMARIPDFKLVGKANNAFEAAEILKTQQVDLMFTDIQMPEQTGIEMVRGLEKPPMVVFTTAYSEHAIEGFELNAVDYLLKPISFDRFQTAVNRATEQHRFHLQEEVPQATETAIEQDFIFVKSDKKMLKINFADILYIEGLKDYVIIRTQTGRVISLQTMKSLDERLPKGQFVRIHRSYIAAVGRINSLVGNMIELTEKGQPKHLPIGKNYKDDLMQWLDKYRL